MESKVKAEGSVRGREGTIQDGAVGEGAEELADELDGSGCHGREAQGGGDGANPSLKNAKSMEFLCFSILFTRGEKDDGWKHPHGLC